MTGLLDNGAAFGFFPQLKRRTVNTNTTSLPIDVLRGRLAGLLGAPSDILNLLQSPQPMEVFGDVNYQKTPELPYGTEHWLKELPLAPTSPAGNVLGKAASFVPLNPAPAIRGVQKVGQMAGEELAATMLGQRPNTLLDKVIPKPAFMVPPEQGLLAPKAPVSDIGFVSALEQTGLNLRRNTGSGQSFLNDLMKGENVKADEIKWIGLDEYLKNKPNVTKQEVQDFISNNKVDVKEVTLGGKQPYDANRLAQLESEYRTLKDHPIDDPLFGETKYDEMIRLMNIRDQSTTNTLYDAAEQATRSAQRAQRQGNNITAEKYFREAELLNTRAEKLDLQGQGMANPPKFGQYTLPGGENYREILLTMPFKEPAMPKGYQVTSVQYDDGSFRYFANTPTTRSAAHKTEEAAMAELQRMASSLKGFRENLDAYKSSHWEQPNVLAHMRVNDRVDADGKKMLLIEEVQSDWHQAGRDKGYKKPMGELPDGWTVAEAPGTNGTWVVKDANGAMVNQGSSREDALNFALSGGSGVPDAPMKDTWYQLALKRAIKYAADNGYERIGLTTGARQAERYDLSKQVDYIDYRKSPDGTFELGVADIHGDAVNLPKARFSAEELPSVVGKEVADKIIKGEGQRGGGRTTLRGIDLQVGGEGMKKYYDEIYPKFLDKYGKKWGAKVGETQIKVGADKVEPGISAPGIGVEFPAKTIPAPMEKVRYIDITPEMKAGVEKGQPLFSAIPAAAVPGLLDEEKRKELTSLLE
jgi:hypothetical protein